MLPADRAYEDRIAALRPLADILGRLVQTRTTELVEFADGFVRPAAFNTEYVHYYTNYRIPVSTDDLDDIVARIAVTRADGGFEKARPAVDYLVTMLEARLPRLVEGIPYRVISLGEDCLARSVPTKWGLKPPRLLGEPSMPFDLAVHPPSAVAEILERDFADYLDPARLIFDAERGFPVDAARGILWNHEGGSDWAVDGFARLRDHYARRIGNLRGALNDGRPCLLFLSVAAPFDAMVVDTVRRIARAVRRLGDNPMTLACAGLSPDSLHASTDRPAHVEVIDGMSVQYFHLPKPYEWYGWPLHEHFTLPAGLVFERDIIDSLTVAARAIT